MSRIGRIAALLVLLVAVGWASAITLPGLVAASGSTGLGGPNCTYIYLTVDYGSAGPADRQTAVAYENLTGESRAAFQQRLASDDGAVYIEKDAWIDIYERSPDGQYVVSNGTLYRARPVLNDCEDWQRYENGTIP